LNSVELLGALVDEIIVVDDSSDVPVTEITPALQSSVARKIRFFGQPGNQGYIVARNTIVREASREHVLLLDDDAFILTAESVSKALRALLRREHAAAVAFGQAEADGRPWPLSMQPSHATDAAVISAYIGFAHLVRRSIFLRLGGYREILHFYGEEKDFCIRLLDNGYEVLFLPDALIAHVPEPTGRSASRYLRYVIRNDCLCALFNEPFPIPFLTVPIRLRRYLTMSRAMDTQDRGGLMWVITEVVRALPTVLRVRSPIRWSTLLRWRRLHRHPQPLPAEIL
jgi:GT2 family glycosyltransferase